MTIHQFPIPTVAALILNADNEFLLLKSDKWSGNYSLPAGKVEFGETLSQAILREIKEETGLEVHSVTPLLVQEIITPDSFHEKAHFVSYNYVCKTEQQEVTLNHEATEYLWASVSKLSQLKLNDPTKELIDHYLKEKEDKVIISNISIPCIVGIHDFEREKLQDIFVSLQITTNIKTPALSKNIEDAVDYDILTKQITSVVQDGEYLLIETMAEDIANLVLRDEKVSNVIVTVKKPSALKNVDFPAIEINRGKSVFN